MHPVTLRLKKCFVYSCKNTNLICKIDRHICIGYCIIQHKHDLKRSSCSKVEEILVFSWNEWCRSNVSDQQMMLEKIQSYQKLAKTHTNNVWLSGKHNCLVLLINWLFYSKKSFENPKFSPKMVVNSAYDKMNNDKIFFTSIFVFSIIKNIFKHNINTFQCLYW